MNRMQCEIRDRDHRVVAELFLYHIPRKGEIIDFPREALGCYVWEVVKVVHSLQDDGSMIVYIYAQPE